LKIWVCRCVPLNDISTSSKDTKSQQPFNKLVVDKPDITILKEPVWCWWWDLICSVLPILTIVVAD